MNFNLIFNQIASLNITTSFISKIYCSKSQKNNNNLNQLLPTRNLFDSSTIASSFQRAPSVWPECEFSVCLLFHIRCTVCWFQTRFSLNVVHSLCANGHFIHSNAISMVRAHIIYKRDFIES